MGVWGSAVPGGVGGAGREEVGGEGGGPLPGQGEAGGQLADGVGGLGAAAVAAQGDDEAARSEDVDVGAAVGGVGVGAAAGVPGADAGSGQQAGKDLAQGGQHAVGLTVVVPDAEGGRIGQAAVGHR